MLGRFHFVLGLDGNMPSVGLSGNRHVLGLALNEAASLVFDPADARQINLPSSFVNLEALREAEGVRCHELLVLLREGRQTFEELLEAAHQILQRLLENLRVRFPQPGILLLSNQQFGAKLRIADMEGGIRCSALFVPSKPLVVHPARTTGEAGHFPVLSSVGFQFERKALANNQAYMILAFIEKPAAYISALNGALRRNLVKSSACTQQAAAERSGRADSGIGGGSRNHRGGLRTSDTTTLRSARGACCGRRQSHEHYHRSGASRRVRHRLCAHQAL